MAPYARTYVFPSPRERMLRLKLLQLTGEIADYVCSQVLQEVGGLSPLEPRGAEVWRVHSAGTRALRERVLPSGWTTAEFEGLSLTVDRTHKNAICIAFGDDGTGVIDSAGPRATIARSSNAGVGFGKGKASIESPSLGLVEDLTSITGFRLWFFVINFSHDELISEISLADTPLCAESGLWRQRVINPPLTRNPQVSALRGILYSEQPDVAISIRRKSQ